MPNSFLVVGTSHPFRPAAARTMIGITVTAMFSGNTER
jgi:hypothetical protein